MKSFEHIPLGYKVSFIMVLVNESAGENAAVKLSNELEKHQIHRDDIINIESNFAHLESEVGFLKITVWFKWRSP